MKRDSNPNFSFEYNFIVAIYPRRYRLIAPKDIALESQFGMIKRDIEQNKGHDFR